MALAASAAGKMEDYVGCKTEYKGILKVYTNIDRVLEIMDLALCSTECPCRFDESVKANFTSNTTMKKYYEKWKNNGPNERFQNCSKELQSNIEKYFLLHDTVYGNYLKNFNISKFSDFWEYIENKFSCTGWCEKEYVYNGTFPGKNETSKTLEGGFYKYLVSGINKGPVEKVGCLEAVIDWLPPKLFAYGIISLLCSIFGIFSFYFGLLLISKPTRKEKELKSG